MSNSWGGSGGRDFYDDIITSWQAAGIVPVFSIGNKGPDCNTAGSPGDRPNVIGVGSTDSNDRISKFSSRGQSKDGKVKPDIVSCSYLTNSFLPDINPFTTSSLNS